MSLMMLVVVVDAKRFLSRLSRELVMEAADTMHIERKYM